MEEATNWGPGLWVLGGAAVAALLFLAVFRKSKSGAVEAGTVDDLTARYQRHVSELKEHLATRHLLPAAEWEAQKSRLERLAAATLRERDGLKHEGLKAAARAEKSLKAETEAAKAKGTLPPGFKGAAIAAAVVGFFALLGYLLSDSTSARSEGMSATGGNPNRAMGGGASPEQSPEDRELHQKLSAAQQDADNVDKLAEAGMALIARQEFDAARQYIARATTIDPFDVRTRIGRGVLLAVDGEPKLSMAELERLADTYPEAWEARFFAALLAREEQDLARALRQLEALVVQAPPAEQPPAVAMLMAELRSQLNQGAAAKP